ncbi:uncharacterized protein LOC100573261 [Acyrthosiphon pisum]|uniref:Uncharacterized protein n=1 Tax=Acyrthosiphon pisum TaxID=7029 RepID=A0A8R2FD93_ACYPI|nr:uncharacterized protein LOC100573261 [Acyrthosiphon pisum]|eukprot:XP_008189878.1 PREDICTED: uncharacterized protein LOC100573261 [Acyrthosiphon pisum]
MKCFIYNFLCVPSLTIEFGVAFLTVVFTILSLVIFGLNASELSSIISKQLIVFVTILLLLLTWCIAVVGASVRSRPIITFTIVLWTIFIIMWLVLSLFFRVIKKNTQYCVAEKTRCATSMWLIGKGGGEEESNEEEQDTDGDAEESEDDRIRLRLKKYSPELTIKTFHPTRANVILTPADLTLTATLAANTVVSNHTSMTIGVNNGFGCERHQWTTTESPPRDLITRLMEYRKHMTMYHQTAVAVIQKRKKIQRKKILEEPLEEEDENEEEENEETEDKGDSSSPIDLLLMSVFLRKIPLFFFCKPFPFITLQTAAMMAIMSYDEYN